MNITNVVEAVITLALFIVTALLIPFVRSNLSAKAVDEVYRWLTLAVKAAEMLYRESGMGAEKKEYVRSFLAQHGYTVDEEEVEVMIEAAVLDLKRAA